MRLPALLRSRRRAAGAAVLVLLFATLIVAGCGGEGGHDDGEALSPYEGPGTPALTDSEGPSWVPGDIRDAYEFALARPDVLQYVPCYCGCGLNAGHSSNLDCFIDGVRSDGAVAFDDHGSG